MSILGVRSEVRVGYSHTRHTGLIWHTAIGSGASQESNKQVPVADLSTQRLGKATTPGELTLAHRIAVAINDRQDNTGV